MIALWDKLLLWLCSLALLAGQPVEGKTVLAMLAALAVSAFGSYLADRRWSLAGAVIYSLLAYRQPELCLFLPLVYYDLFLPRQVWWAVAGASVTLASGQLSLARQLPVHSLLAVSAVLSQRTRTLVSSQAKLRAESDSGREQAWRLERQHQRLLEQQDYEIHLATLRERNRIAREIHDQVGHLLSRSLLQTAALLVSAEARAQENSLLHSLRDTLAEAMDSIRDSVHDLHDHALDLSAELQSLAAGFLFCPIKLDYRVQTEPGKALQACLLAAVKEGLHNISKHSDATAASLTVIEHPALYQLILQDNGSRPGPRGQAGLGLDNMAERVQALGGQFSATYQGGFRIFISLPR